MSAIESKSTGATSKLYNCCLCTTVNNPHMIKCKNCGKKYHKKCAQVDSDVNKRQWICNLCVSAPPDNDNLSIHGTDNDGVVTRSKLATIGTGATSNMAQISNVANENKFIDNINLKQSLFAPSNIDVNALSLMATGASTVPQEQAVHMPPPQQLTSGAIQREAERFRPTSPTKSIRSSSSHKSAASKARMEEEEQILREEAEILRQRQELLNRRKELLQRMEQISSDSESGEDEHHNPILRYAPMRHPQVIPSQQIPVPENVQWLPNIVPSNICEPAEAVLIGTADQRRLTRNQIAARTSVGKELPKFSGKPEEWPLFLATYNQTTAICGFSQDENIIRLRKALEGPARQSVKNLLLHAQCVPQVIATLKMKFGRPELIINVLLQQIRNMPPPTQENLESLVNFALEVQNVCASMKASGLQMHINNPELEQKLVMKLPAIYQAFWGMHKSSLTDSNLEHFSNWLFQLAQGANSVIVPGSSQKERKHGVLNTHSEASVGSKLVSCIVCKSDGHAIFNCISFKEMSRTDKWEIVRKHKLCRRCLRLHNSFNCRVKTACGIDGCTLRHHQLLHKSQNDSATNKVYTHISDNNAVLFRIVPVILYGDGIKISTYAFLDDGSSITLIDAELQRKLNIHGTKRPLCLRWTGNTHRYEDNSVVADIAISAPNGKRFMLRDVHTVEQLDLPSQSLDVDVLKSKYKHLRKVPLQSYRNIRPKLLIGLNNSGLTSTIKTRTGSLAEPIAEKSRIGWTVKGELSTPGKVVPEHHVYHICDCTNSACVELLNSLKAYVCLDDLGVIAKPHVNLSNDDKLALNLLETFTKRVGNRFQTSLLWKYPTISLPDSLPMAKRRAQCLRSRMLRDPQMYEILQVKISEYLEKGYIRRLSPGEIEVDKCWYLPIFPVINPNKPNKVRLVWDAAARVNGISLNSVLLKGPDQLTSLLSILCRFRQRSVAIGGDIAEMFHQVMVRPEDQNYQRFLWYERGTQQPSTYVMTVMTFGATCSPSCAQYVKNKNAQEYEGRYPGAVQCILNSHYVDDMLDSVDTEEEAFQLATEVQYIHQKGAFHIRNWVSNSRTVLKRLNADRLEDVNLDMDNDMVTEKVLGMWWATTEDCLTFRMSEKMRNSDLIHTSRRPTKREVLSLIMTIFDPLGLIGYFIMYAKIIMQDIWRSGCSWDEYIPDEVHVNWLRWIKILPKMEGIKIPRCYIIQPSVNYPELELDTFVDASIHGYAAVSYFRYYVGDDAHCVLVASKTRVAPLKMLSIPRLELQAAVLGTRLAKSIIEFHSVPIKKSHFWTDSSTVISWINSDHRRYQQFVGFRISEILETTDPVDWHWISTRDNVADEATKWKRVPEISTDTRWFIGPDFLRLHPSRWPKKSLLANAATTEELRAQYVGVLHESQLNEFIKINVTRHSTWRKLINTTAAVIYCAKIWLNRVRNTPDVDTSYRTPRSEDFRLAEIMLWKQAQFDTFKDELFSLKDGRYVDRSSPIYKLSPYLDNNNIIRLASRFNMTGHNDLVILPKDHCVTHLIVSDSHVKFHHRNSETVVNDIRRRYWVPRLRVLVNQVKRRCQYCKINSAHPKPPRMGNLPHARVAAFQRPFSYVGVDYFGPILVSIRRSNEKRYGVLFTCLTTRAIHIEIAHTLATDSCIIAMRNFIARRGNPIEIWSDNGTNFRSAEKELRAAFALVDKNKIIKAFTSSSMTWKFIPPASPHMGGAWERLVRSVKDVLYSILQNQKINDEILRAALMEAEMVVNSRPLTYIPISNCDEEALTPNHFLLGGSVSPKPLSEVDADGLALRKSWYASQQLANSFWRRWVREYLPIITRRSKWFQMVKPIEVGDIVIIVDPNSPRNCWPKGRVIKVRKGSDEQVRSAMVKTITGIYERPATKLAVLDLDVLVKPSQATPGGSVKQDLAASSPTSKLIPSGNVFAI